MRASGRLFTSKHFQIEQLADGVYAAIYVAGGTAISNAGIIDLGERTLVYDTLMTPQSGADLRAAAETLIGRPVDTVIDSHWHYDHIWGNQAFAADTDIISSAETWRMIIATGGHGAFAAFLAAGEADLAAVRAQLQSATDDGQRRQFGLWVDYRRGVVETKPVLKVRAPNQTFVERMTFHGTRRCAELIDFAGGHTESDSVLFLPQERIAFMSDLLFIGYQPYLGGGDPDRILQILAQVSTLAPQVLVPGHGPVGGPDSMRAMSQYIQTLDGLARKMLADGVAEETIDKMAVPAPFEDWLFGSFFPGNMHFLFQLRQRQ